MRYWWVNQNETYRHELSGGYLWSPKRKTNGHRNPFYDFMREVSPGDVVFSFADAQIKAVGVAASHCYESPKPLEFGTAGAHWHRIGWRVDVRFHELRGAIRPAEYMDVLRPHLPARYSPLRSNGAGLQNVYLANLSESFAAALVDLIGIEARVIMRQLQVRDAEEVRAATGLVEWEEHQVARLRVDSSIPETTREAIVQARRGQGVFKQNVLRIERACRVTGVDQLEHLRASHCKPWRDASNDERLDGENGLLLTPDVDHLFDRGFIGFEDNGRIIISPVAHTESLARMGLGNLEAQNVGRFSDRQRAYLQYHRDEVLLKSDFLS